MGKSSHPRRGDIYWVSLDPAVGTKVKKTRPAVILSNDAQNRVGQRVLAAPITSSISRIYPFEAPLTVAGKPGKAMLDQVRCLDATRLQARAGRATSGEMKAIEAALRLAFELV